MLDIKFIRENKDLIQAGAQKKRIDFKVDALIAIDEKRRDVLRGVEEKRQAQNVMSKEIAGLTDLDIRAQKIAEMQTLKSTLQEEEDTLKKIMKEWQSLMLSVPNIPDMSVPDGATDADNVEIRTHGEIPELSFTPKHHIDILEAKDMVDLEGGVRISGFRGYVLKGAGGALLFALWRFAIDHMMKRGFEFMVVPSMVNREGLIGTGYLPQGEEDLYKTQDGQYLAGTGEVGTMAYLMDQTFKQDKLPKKIVAFSPCFRREVGSHGKDTRGLIRVHEFYKVEQVVVCDALHATSVTLHEEMLNHAEELMQALEIPYRVVLICGGDLGLPAVKKYDIEAWVPSEKTYRETHSASYFHDFQSRRMNIKVEREDGKKVFAHTINSTVAATPRLIAALVENHQQADGSIRIPKALIPFLGTDRL